MLLLLALACTGPDTADTGPTGPEPRRHLLYRPEHKPLILGRLDSHPYDRVHDRIQAIAAEELQADEPGSWDRRVNIHNADVVQANAVLAWLHDDDAAAAKALEGLATIESEFWRTHGVSDINIRMPHFNLGMTDGIGLLLDAGYLSEDEAAPFIAELADINAQFYEDYVQGELLRNIWLTPAQNNHPIRTAAAIGYVAMAFPEAPGSDEQLNWAVSEMDYLWSPATPYVQADGGVSEGPFYFGFAWGVSTLFFAAMHNGMDPDHSYVRSCINRSDKDPWTGHGCVEGESFTFDNPLFSDSFHATAEWSLALSLPSGHRPPLADAYFNPFNGGGLLTGFGGDPTLVWDWERNVDRPYEMRHGIETAPAHLLWLDPDAVAAAAPPEWTSRYLPDAGHAVFRSGWDADAVWMLLVAEGGDARKTVHDHADGLSLSMAAYGEYLLLDPGYYKPNPLNNARTSAPEAHNKILIDGSAGPDKGLLVDWGDTDAQLTDWHQGDGWELARGSTSYEDTDFVRTVLFIEGRWAAVVDQLDTAQTEARPHSWRMNGYAGHGSGGSFELRDDGARWERALAGVDVYLASDAGDMSFVEPEFHEDDAPNVHQFELDRSVATHAVMDGEITAVAPGFVAVLAPYRVGVDASSPDAPLTVSRTGQGWAVGDWEVRLDGGEVVLLEGGSELWRG